MEMAEVPFLINHQFFQTAQELGGLTAFDSLGHVRDLVDKAGRRRMGDDVIDGEVVGCQVLGGVVEVFGRRLFLGPPGHTGPALCLIRRLGPAEGEEGPAFEGEDFAAQQVIEIRP